MYNGIEKQNSWNKMCVIVWIKICSWGEMRYGMNTICKGTILWSYVSQGVFPWRTLFFIIWF